MEDKFVINFKVNFFSRTFDERNFYSVFVTFLRAESSPSRSSHEQNLPGTFWIISKGFQNHSDRRARDCPSKSISHQDSPTLSLENRYGGRARANNKVRCFWLGESRHGTRRGLVKAFKRKQRRETLQTSRPWREDDDDDDDEEEDGPASFLRFTDLVMILWGKRAFKEARPRGVEEHERQRVGVKKERKKKEEPEDSRPSTLRSKWHRCEASEIKIFIASVVSNL